MKTNGQNLIDLITGREKIKINADLPTLKIETTEQTNKLIKTSVFMLAGAVVFLGISSLTRKK